MILLDPNLLIRMTRSNDPQSGVARAAIQTLVRRGERLIVVPQNLYEFRVVATRSAGAPPIGRNGPGMSPAQAALWIHFIRSRFILLPDREEPAPSGSHWSRLKASLAFGHTMLVWSPQCRATASLDY